uniref:Reverse transcriptase domain-containing protein n=1 Tax=Tanacetum cinerariifolium TaxID=118510 RepID=A0A699GLR2_TANCI|nr:reverse transcriptase domain-containing protein [Tanacetum cinerariifolium]
MSDSEDSTITYTAVSSQFEGLSDIRSPGVDGPPVMPEDPYAYMVASFQAPPSPNYVSGPEHPPSPVYVPKFVPEPVYLEFMPAEDDILPVEEKPLPAVASPTTESPDEGDDEDESSDDDDIDIEGDEDEDESSDDDEDDDIDIEGDEDLAPTDSTTVTLPAIDHAPSVEETKFFKTDESTATPPLHPAYRVTARMSIRPQTSISLPLDTEISRFMAIPTPPPSPLSPLSSPLPQIPSPLLPLLSPPPTDPTYEESPLGYRAARLRWRAEKGEIPKAYLPLWKRLWTAYTSTYELGASFLAAAARVREPVRDDLYRPQILDYSQDTTGGDQGVAGSRPHATGTVHTCTDFTEVMSNLADYSSRTHSDLRSRQSPSTAIAIMYSLLSITGNPRQKMEPKRTTRANPATTTTTITTSVIDAQLEALIEQGVAKALAARPLNFKGKEGVVELTQWFEKMETVLCISNCSIENQIKFSTCTLLRSTLTWWNFHVITVGPNVAYEMTWVDLKKKMTDKYCPRGEMKKLESELWNLRVKINDVQQQNKRQNTGRTYTAGSSEKKPYGGSKPLCPKCNYHHDGPCSSKCHKFNKVGYFARDCRSIANVNTTNNQRGNGTGQKPTFYEYGA